MKNRFRVIISIMITLLMLPVFNSSTASFAADKDIPVYHSCPIISTSDIFK